MVSKLANWALSAKSARFAGWLRELKLKFTVVIILAIALVYTDSHNTMATTV
jgi:hypothetical protein